MHHPVPYDEVATKLIHLIITGSVTPSEAHLRVNSTCMSINFCYYVL